MGDVDFASNFHTENKETKVLLERLSELQHKVYNDATDLKDADLDVCIDYCTLLVRLANCIEKRHGGNICTRKKIIFLYQGTYHESLYREIMIHVIDTANLFMSVHFLEEEEKGFNRSVDERDRVHQSCREIVGLLSWVLDNVYRKKSWVANDDCFSENRANQLRTWIRAFSLWNGCKKNEQKWKDHHQHDILILAFGVKIAKTCRLLMSKQQGYIKCIFRKRVTAIQFKNNCGLELIGDVKDDPYYRKPTEQSERDLRGKWSQLAATEFILMEAVCQNARGATEQSLGLLALAELNGRLVKGIKDKRIENNKEIHASAIPLASTCLSLLEKVATLPDGQTMLTGQNPLEATPRLGNDTLSFHLYPHKGDS